MRKNNTYFQEMNFSLCYSEGRKLENYEINYQNDFCKLLNHEEYVNLFKYTLRNPDIPLKTMLYEPERQISDVIREIIRKYEVDELYILNQIYFFMDYKFRDIFLINLNFEDLLNKDPWYHQYFRLLEFFVLSFIYTKNIDYYTFYGTCEYVPEIDFDEKSLPKITFYFPTSNYDLVLDYLEEFMKTQEKFLKNKITHFGVYKEINKKFKKTIFLFERKFM